MTNGDEFSKALLKLLVEIAEREKKKAVQNDDYGRALAITVVKEIFAEAERSI